MGARVWGSTRTAGGRRGRRRGTTSLLSHLPSSLRSVRPADGQKREKRIMANNRGGASEGDKIFWAISDLKRNRRCRGRTG